jgi:hypothetical protein
VRYGQRLPPLGRDHQHVQARPQACRAAFVIEWDEDVAVAGAADNGSVVIKNQMNETIRINRAPVLTLWAAVVAERLGLPRDTALTIGQALAGLTAYSKGVRLGIYAPPELRPHEAPPVLPAGATKVHDVVLLGRQIHVADTAHGQRAIAKGELVKPEAVERYLNGKFGDALGAVRTEMERLASRFPPERLNHEGFHLYEQFRPEVPSDERGWGAKGVLDLTKIRALATR